MHNPRPAQGELPAEHGVSLPNLGETMTDQILFKSERHARCRAALERDLAATAIERVARRRHLAAAARHAAAVPGTFNEALLIRR